MKSALILRLLECTHDDYEFAVMGFEQLAHLKKQLAEQAKASTAKKPARSPQSTQSTPREPVDPVVHTIGTLQKRYPRAFPKNPSPKVPLKVGVIDDLLQQASDLRLSEKELRDAIKLWCRGARYWSCLVEGASRIDLNGNVAGEVSPADAEHAQYMKTQRLSRASSTPATAKSAA